MIKIQIPNIHRNRNRLTIEYPITKKEEINLCIEETKKLEVKVKEFLKDYEEW